MMFAIAIVIFLALAFAGMPIGFVFALLGFAGTVLLKGWGPGLSLLGSAPWQWSSQGGLIVVPLFVLMGSFAFHSKISEELYVAAYKWFGRFPGGLAIATCIACTGFAACTGTSLASGAAMGTIAYPEMKRFHYDDRLATGVICVGGTLGILIPPSLIFIIYGFLTQQPVGVLFIAGIMPGIMMSTLYILTILFLCLRNPLLGPRGESFSWKERVASMRHIWGMLALFLLVIGGLYAGIFAPSEAGAIGAFGAFIIVLVRRGFSLKVFRESLRESLTITVFSMAILIGAMMFSVFVTVSGVPALFAEWVTELGVSRWYILILILAIYIPLGMILDNVSMILLTLPTVYPIVQALGFDMVWFGVLIVLANNMALITPPVGMVVYVVQGVTKVPMGEVFKGIFPFLGAMFIGWAILVAFPVISLWLPYSMR